MACNPIFGSSRGVQKELGKNLFSLEIIGRAYIELITRHKNAWMEPCPKKQNNIHKDISKNRPGEIELNEIQLCQSTQDT